MKKIKNEMMKKLFLIFNCMLFVNITIAQQKPYYTQYILNNYIINPAFAGIENYTDIKFSYRNQWTDLEGAPVTSYLTINKPFSKEQVPSTVTTMQYSEDNPYVRSSDLGDVAAHHGGGITFITDKTGYISRTTFGLTYAYHKPLSSQLILAAGITGGFSNVNLDRSKIVWGSLDPNDPAIGYNSGDLRKVIPEISAGIVLYNANLFVAASALNIVPGKVNFVKNDIYGDLFKPHVFVQTGYKFYLNDDFFVVPSASLQFINPLPMFVHLNAKMNYKNLAWIGAGYRLKDNLSGLAVMSGINVAKTINVSYAYNSTVNARLKTYVGNTHEIVVGISIGKKPESCPTNVW